MCPKNPQLLNRKNDPRLSRKYYEQPIKIINEQVQ